VGRVTWKPTGRVIRGNEDDGEDNGEGKVQCKLDARTKPVASPHHGIENGPPKGPFV
jgi:hypothetical protein